MKLYLAGHRGMVGSALARTLGEGGAELITRTREDADLREQSVVRELLQSEKPDVVIVAAAKVGGIGANQDAPAEFIRDNVAIQTNLIHESWSAGVERLLFLASSCIYPKFAEQPMAEEALLTGALEPTNEPYAVAKISGLKLCESYRKQYGVDYRSVIPTNLYGPGDAFSVQTSHVVPALLPRFHAAAIEKLETVSIWGSGSPRREFLHVDDMAAGCLAVLDCERDRYEEATGSNLNHLNIGTGTDITIAELASMIAEIAGFEGEIACDTNKPDGTPRKLLDVSRINKLGWTAQIGLREGLEATYQKYLESGEYLRLK
jgi:nucleoside-diphosphate-sugar epimerase